MAGPITWRTINAPSVAEASRPLQVAEQSINSAFDRLIGVVDKREAANQGVIDRADEANVQGFLDRIQRAQTPEQVAAMQASGELDTLRAAISPKNLAKVRGAEEARTSGLMKQIGERATFADQQLDREQAPIRDRIMGLVANGETDRALGELAQNPNLRNSAAIFQAVKTGERDLTKFGWESDKQKWAGQEAAFREELRPLEKSSKQASINASNAQVAAAEENRVLAAEQRAAAKAAAEAQAQSQLLKDSGNVFARDGLFTPDNTEALVKLVDEAGIEPEKRGPIFDRLRKLGGTMPLTFVGEDGKEKTVDATIPLALVKQAILGSQDQALPFFAPSGANNNTTWGWNEGNANTMEAGLRKSMLETFKDSNGKATNKILFDFDQYIQNTQKRADNPSSGGSKKSK